jgi:putative hydrolase
MDPQEALLEIARLLERERASRYRAKAFRAAARESMPNLPGGRATGSGPDPAKDRILDVRGDPPGARRADASYLVELRGEVEPEIVSELRTRLRGDLHAHTEWSDGTTPIGAMADRRALGHEYLAITDHSPRLRVRNLTAERLRRSCPRCGRSAATAHDAHRHRGRHPRRRAPGSGGSAARRARHRGRLGALQAGHGTRADDRRMVAAVSNPRVSVLGHVTGQLVQGERGTRPPSRFDGRAVFEACAEHGVAVEINSRPERQDPPDALLALALEIGCLFSIDSDAHAPASCRCWTTAPNAPSGPGSRGADRDDVGARAPAALGRLRAGSAVRLSASSARAIDVPRFQRSATPTAAAVSAASSGRSGSSGTAMGSAVATRTTVGATSR